MRRLLVAIVLFALWGSAPLGIAWVRPVWLDRHERVPLEARVSAALARELDREIERKPPRTVEEAIDLAVRVTRERLRFGLSHRTSLAFDVPVREGNCVEYAQLTAWVIARAHADAHAQVVRSRARLFGLRVPLRGWDDHDWVRVEANGRVFTVDALLFDAINVAR